MQRRALLALPLLAPSLLAWPALAQPAWPTRPVRVINPYSPGGTTDVAMRLVAPRLERDFGQPFPIEARPGAGGAVGTLAAAQSTDGHTLLITNTGPLAVAPSVMANPGYDPARDFRFIHMFGGAPIVIAVKADGPIRTLEQFVAAARARPEAVSYGNSGPGSMGHLAGLAFEGATGAKLLHIPFRGAPEAQAGVLSGDVVALMDTVGAHAGAIRQGGLRAIAFTSEGRVPLFPEVPTLREAGMAQGVISNWFLLAAPATLPEAVAARLAAPCRAAAAEPAVRERLEALGLVPLGDMTPEQIRAFVVAEGARWKPVIEAAGLRA